MKKDKDKVHTIIGTPWFILTNKRGTFCLIKVKTEKMYFLQFTTKDMWLKPTAKLICQNTIKMYGWLFFYVGYKVTN